MTRDWSLTLLALSPYLLAVIGAATVVLALARRPAQNERVRRRASE